MISPFHKEEVERFIKEGSGLSGVRNWIRLMEKDRTGEISVWTNYGKPGDGVNIEVVEYALAKLGKDPMALTSLFSNRGFVPLSHFPDLKYLPGEQIVMEGVG